MFSIQIKPDRPVDFLLFLIITQMKSSNSLSSHGQGINDPWRIQKTDLVSAINSEITRTLIAIIEANSQGPASTFVRTPPAGVSFFEHKPFACAR